MDIPLSDEIRSVLRCPETGQLLREATPEELSGFAGNLSESGFVTEDGIRVYPIRDGFPLLIVAEAIVRGN